MHSVAWDGSHALQCNSMQSGLLDNLLWGNVDFECIQFCTDTPFTITVAPFVWSILHGFMKSQVFRNPFETESPSLWCIFRIVENSSGILLGLNSSNILYTCDKVGHLHTEYCSVSTSVSALLVRSKKFTWEHPKKWKVHLEASQAKHWDTKDSPRWRWHNQHIT